ncbi:hypothetical protein ACOSQ2_017741 [Xanthoceras sorbifolium]
MLWPGGKCDQGFFAIMAPDLLTIPMFTIVSESVFKTLDVRNYWVLNNEKSILTVEIVESLFCIKDGEDADTRNQCWTDEINYFAISNEDG